MLREWWRRLGEWLDEPACRTIPPVFRALVVLLLVDVVAAAGPRRVGRLADRARRGGSPRSARRASRWRDAATRQWYYREADRAAAAGRWRRRCSSPSSALALTLDAQGLLRYHPSKTPAECARDAKLAAADRERLRGLVGALYAHVFGGRPCAADDYRRWREAGAPTWHAPAQLRSRSARPCSWCSASARRRSGSRRARVGDSDPRRSTFLAGPSGASGYRRGARAPRRPGGRSRRPPAPLDRATRVGRRRRLSRSDGAARLCAKERAIVAAAGRSPARRPGSGAAMRCLGYDVVRWRGDSVAVAAGRRRRLAARAFVRWLLRRAAATSWPTRAALRRRRRVLRRSGSPHGSIPCSGAARPAGRALAHARRRAGRHARSSDDRLFSNRALREIDGRPVRAGARGAALPPHGRRRVSSRLRRHRIAGGATLAGAPGRRGAGASGSWWPSG